MYELEAHPRAYHGDPRRDWRWAEEGEIGINGKQGVWKQLVTWSSDAMRGHWWDQTGVSTAPATSASARSSTPRHRRSRSRCTRKTAQQLLPVRAGPGLQLPPLYLTEEQAGHGRRAGDDDQQPRQASTAQFITGELDPNDDGAWDDYVTTLDAMGLSTYLETQQAAYDAKTGA